MRALLMGGQACILYGAAEFTRDVDVAVAASPAELDRLRRALDDLRCEPVYFPPLSREALQRGHACHFRCQAPGVEGLRIDVMSVLRGADPFSKLWARRERVAIPGAGRIPVMALRDLVQVKKTQRDKDWPMVRRLIEADIARGTRGHWTLWLMECRTPELLLELTSRMSASAKRLARRRPAIRAAMRGDRRGVERALRAEEDRERAADRRYWAPLRRELERMRHAR